MNVFCTIGIWKGVLYLWSLSRRIRRGSSAEEVKGKSAETESQPRVLENLLDTNSNYWRQTEL